MDIINSNNNMLNPSGEVVFFYNFNSRLTVLVDGSWSIRDAVYRVALILSRGSSLVFTHRTADVRVTSDIPGTP